MSNDHFLSIDAIKILKTLINTAKSEKELDMIVRKNPVECMFNKKINLYLKVKRITIREI